VDFVEYVREYMRQSNATIKIVVVAGVVQAGAVVPRSALWKLAHCGELSLVALR